MFKRFLAWRGERVRLAQCCTSPHYPYYIRFTPNLGIGFPLSETRRVRLARQHGLQITRWTGKRWVVEKQLLGKSTVKGEVKDGSVRNL
jgi:hypothetical protein